MKRNPRKIAWTQIYRRLHKKGTTEEAAKKKTRKAQRVQRAIVGASLEIIKAKRTQVRSRVLHLACLVFMQGNNTRDVEARGSRSCS